MLFSLPLLAQEKVAYTSDFQFKDGIYLSFDDFKNNNPIPITHIVSNHNIQASDYLETVLNEKEVVYYDNLYEERKVNSIDVWGFSQNGKVSIGHGSAQSIRNPSYFGWYPLVLIGSICYFPAVELEYRSMPIPPSFGAQPGNYHRQETFYEDRVQVHLLIEFSTGKTIRLSTGQLDAIPTGIIEDLIYKDTKLHDEFIALSKKEKKNKAMFFIRKFNQNNPIYFSQ